MNKWILLMTLISCISFAIPNSKLVYAKSNDNPPSVEEGYTQVGYKSVNQAVKDFENHYKRDVSLPLRLPPIPFTHQVGRFSEDKEYDINDVLDVEFINEKSPENHFNIYVRPLKNKIHFTNRCNQRTLMLNNGQESIYIRERLFNILVFEKGNWQYMLGIDKRVANTVTPEVLEEIANSID